MTRVLFLISSLLVLDVRAIGLQHAVFRSQATQGPAWTGTVEIVAERYDITVQPDHLIVELDWEFAVGGTKPEKYANALEIVGNLNLEMNSSVTGMLVWYKDLILKGKLKTTAHARKDYEEVVDRNSPVPPKPRDPVLLEWIRQDNYDISIFPVEWGGTRKLRIRYLVPIQNGVLGYPHAFSDKAQVTLKRGKGVKGFVLVNTRAAVEFTDPVVELSREEYEFRAYQWNSSKRNPTSILPLLQDSLTASRIFLGSFSGAGFPGSFSGHMAHFFLRVPGELLDIQSPPGMARIHAELRAGNDICKKAIGINPMHGIPGEMFRLFTKDPVSESITWTLHHGDSLIRVVTEKPTVARVEDPRDYACSFGNIPFYPMASTMPKSLGVTLGFIDSRYSLVALEKDALPIRLAARYALGAMPALEPGDIHPDMDEAYQVPVETWLRDRSLTREYLLQPSYRNLIGAATGILPSQLPSGIRFRIEKGILSVDIDPQVLSSGLELSCALHGADGRLVHSWRTEELRSGRLTWSPSGRASGTYYLKLTLGKRNFSQMIHFR